MVKAFPLNQQEYSYNAQDVSYYYAGRHSGVFALDTNCQVSIVNGMDVKIAKGKGWLAHGVDYGVVFWMEEDVLLTVPVGDVASPRWDFICIGWETSGVSQNPTVYVKSGTPANSPAEPTLENSSSKIEICLAKIYIPVGTTSLTAGDVQIIDTRNDSKYCGLVGDESRTTELEDRADSLEKINSNLDTRTSSLENTASNLVTRTTNLENGTTPADKTKKLSTARKINGTSFDGTGDITTSIWGASRKIFLDGKDQGYINGSADINLKSMDIVETTLSTNQSYTINTKGIHGYKQLYVFNNNRQRSSVNINNNSNTKALVFFTDSYATDVYYDIIVKQILIDKNAGSKQVYYNDPNQSSSSDFAVLIVEI